MYHPSRTHDLHRECNWVQLASPLIRALFWIFTIYFSDISETLELVLLLSQGILPNTAISNYRSEIPINNVICKSDSHPRFTVFIKNVAECYNLHK